MLGFYSTSASEMELLQIVFMLQIPLWTASLVSFDNAFIISLYRIQSYAESSRIDCAYIMLILPEKKYIKIIF